MGMCDDKEIQVLTGLQPGLGVLLETVCLGQLS